MHDTDNWRPISLAFGDANANFPLAGTGVRAWLTDTAEGVEWADGDQG